MEARGRQIWECTKNESFRENKNYKIQIESNDIEGTKLTNEIVDIVLIVDTIDNHLPIWFIFIVAVSVARDGMTNGPEVRVSTDMVTVTLMVQKVTMTDAPKNDM